jgi:acetyltransferase
VGRLSKQHTPGEAEFSVLVNDEWQRLGLGSELLRRLIEIGRDEKLAHLSGVVLAENHAMQHICRKVGFKVVLNGEDNSFKASYTY